MTDNQPPARRTRAANAFAHPGHIVLQDQVKRRSKQEMAEARKLQSFAKAVLEHQRRETIENAAAVQRTMAQRDAEEQAQRVLPPRFAVKSNKSSNTSGSRLKVASNGPDADTESIESDTPLSVTTVTPAKVKKPRKKAIRQEIDSTAAATTAQTFQAVTQSESTGAGKSTAGKRKSAVSDSAASDAGAGGQSKRLKPMHPSGMLTSWKGAATPARTAPPSMKARPGEAVSMPPGSSRVVSAIKVDVDPSDDEASSHTDSGDDAAVEFTNGADIDSPPGRQTNEGIVGVAPEVPSDAPAGTQPAPSPAPARPRGVGFINFGSDFQGTPMSMNHGNTQAIARLVAARRHVTNHDLPSGTLNKYNREFMPKLIEFIARLPNPWELQVINFAAELRRLWSEVFPDVSLGYRVESPLCPLYALSMQRLYNWRSSFGVNAIAAVKHQEKHFRRQMVWDFSQLA
ncbi:uncharacterized protein B0H18DRAFT_964430 [Fomitopsis serialis]|uniref:uncharacterized protein n=1 Tax=Fomitopsis serialis TaxID=139415 RepID=UPI002007F85F|nr:uncharacterized protein B0H18DRAFT_964430 [Neoantrodia serialis]KAH9907675.1 hypothetical protein B0H18DRAFT_964430 [Neoantrodia serialis]